MSDVYKADVFNQSAAFFHFAASGIQYEGPGPAFTEMFGLLRETAPWLHDQFASYISRVGKPFVAHLEAQGLVQPGRGDNEIGPAFTVGTIMAYKMIHNVHLDTGAELPDLDHGTLSGPEEQELPDHDPDTAVIDLFYRGSALRDNMPHVYGASLVLMESMLREPAARLGTDLDSPFAQHRDPMLAWRELHFMAGAAETALTIEAQAAHAG